MYKYIPKCSGITGIMLLKIDKMLSHWQKQGVLKSNIITNSAI